MDLVGGTTFNLKTGKPFVVRLAKLEDAAGLIDFLQAVSDESEFLVSLSHEFDMTEDEERKWIQEYTEDSGKIAIVAEAAGRLIGCLSFANGRRQRLSHRGDVGMSVRGSFRGNGVGTALLGSFLSWAESHPLIEKVGLGVFCDNLPAIGLYKKFGFVEEGRQPREIKMAADKYQDVLLMYRFVKEPRS